MTPLQEQLIKATHSLAFATQELQAAHSRACDAMPKDGSPRLNAGHLVARLTATRALEILTDLRTQQHRLAALCHDLGIEGAETSRT